MQDEKLAISFWPWGLFDTCGNGIYHNCDLKMKETAERGFNCVRMESGAGLFCSPDGVPRGKIQLNPPFGKFSKLIRQMNILRQGGLCDIKDRLLNIFQAADHYGIKIILSSWFFLHTNWFLGDEINNPIFALSTKEKIFYFADELNRILSFLQQNCLIHCVAFAEIFNEFDGLPFSGEYHAWEPSHEEAALLRKWHEDAVDKLKADHPDILFAYDSSSPDIIGELIPQNIDILNFHSYFMWPVYNLFEQGMISWEASEPEIPESTAKFLKMELRTADIIKEIGKPLMTGRGWATRVRLYADIDETKLKRLECLLQQELEKNQEKYRSRMKAKIEQAICIRNSFVPHARLVMGEGVTYCASSQLLFEEKSDLYWELLYEQAKFLSSKNFYGAVVRTNSGPEDPSWTMRREDYLKINRLFLK